MQLYIMLGLGDNRATRSGVVAVLVKIINKYVSDFLNASILVRGLKKDSTALVSHYFIDKGASHKPSGSSPPNALTKAPYFVYISI